LSDKQVTVRELPAFAASISKSVMKEHEKRFADGVKSVKRSAIELSHSASRFGAAIKNAWGSIDKATSEQGVRLTQLIEETATDLAKQQTGVTYAEAEIFHEKSVAATNTVIVATRKYLPKIHRTLKSEIAALNTSLVKLEEAIKTLGNALDQSPGAKLVPLEREITLLSQEHQLLRDIKTQQVKTETEITKTTNDHETLLAKRKELLETPKFRELKGLEEKLNERAEEIKQYFQPLMKPLLKYHRIIMDQRSYPVELAVLEKLIDEPVNVLLTSQPAATLQILRELRVKLERGELEIDERKRRKVEENISKLSEITERFRSDYAALNDEISKRQNGLRSVGLFQELERLNELLTEKNLALQHLNATQADYARKMGQFSETITKRKTSIELQLSKLWGHVTVELT
jgi:hypothetical protein